MANEPVRQHYKYATTGKINEDIPKSKDPSGGKSAPKPAPKKR